MYDEIVDFAELHEFMDQKLKNYSSGMQVRLAFSIAIKAQGDILVLDEVLAVGDEAFQKKCFSYFTQLKREKKTVVLVTHDMSTIERFCNKAVFLEKGVVKLTGKPHKVAAAYSRSNDNSYDQSLDNEKLEESAAFEVEIINDGGKAAKRFNHMDIMTVKLTWKQQNVKNIGVAVFRDNGEYVFGPNTHQDKYILKTKNQSAYNVKLNLNEGEYFLKVALMGDDDDDIIAFIEEGPHFNITKDYNVGKWGGVTKLDHEWN